MVQDDIKAINRRLGETLGQTDLLIIYDNEKSVQPDERKVWCRFSILPGDRVLADTGGRYEQDGFVVLQIMVPVTAGTLPGYAISEQFDAAFRNWRSPDMAIKFGKAVLQPMPNSPGYYQLNHYAYWKSIRAV